MLNNKITIKACNFDYTQMDKKTVQVRLAEVENVVDEQGAIINYKLHFMLEDIENAVVSYTMYKLDKMGFAVSLKTVTALQLSALKLLKQETKKGYKTGRVTVDIEKLTSAIGKTYTAQFHLIDAVADGRAYVWKLLLPENADAALIEQIRKSIENSKISNDVMDNDKTVSFDSLRDNELSDISGQGW